MPILSIGYQVRCPWLRFAQRTATIYHWGAGARPRYTQTMKVLDIALTTLTRAVRLGVGRLLVGTFFSLAGLLVPSAPVHAGACCMSATAVGSGRLLNWEDAAIGLNTSVAFTLGEWTQDGTWRSFDDYDEVEVRGTLWGMARLGRRTSVSVAIPAVLNFRSVGDQSAWGGFLGDVSAGFRWDPRLVAEDSSLVPAVAVVASVTVPTGRATGGTASGKLGENATGRGAWVISAGVILETVVMPWFARLELHTSVPMPSASGPGGGSLRFGPGLSGGLSGGHALTTELTLALAWRWLWESSHVIDGTTVEGSERFDTGLTLALSWRFDTHWTMTTSVDTGIFADGAGDNGFGRVTATVGFRYGAF